MKKTILFLVVFAFCAAATLAQTSRAIPFLGFYGSDPICSRVGSVYFNTATGYKYCTAPGNPGTWVSFSSGGGTGILELNGLTADPQVFAVGTSGTNFNISSSGSTHTFNIPTASGTNRGLLSTTDYTALFGSKTAAYVYAAPTGSSGSPTFRALADTDIPSLAASKITSGTFSTSLIPSLDASKITSGNFATARIVTGTVTNSRCLRVNSSGNIVVASDDCGTGGGGGSSSWGSITGTLSDQTDLQNALDAKANLTQAINSQSGTTYTLQASDAGKTIVITNASAITVTVPSGLGAGFWCNVIQGGAGQITFAESSTTINNFASETRTAGQYAAVTLLATASNVFILTGQTGSLD